MTKASLMAVTMFLTACAQQQLDQFNKSVADFNQAMASGAPSVGRPTAAPAGLAQNTDSVRGTQTQLVVPTDKNAEAALNAALPTIKKVIALHQCMRDGSSARLFAQYAVPGGENNIFVYGVITDSHSPIVRTKFHDKNKCVSVRAIDQITLLALNTLQFRVVYFAEDSGEASNFQMQFVRADDGSWKLSRIMLLT